jgi:hypothetical protein
VRWPALGGEREELFASDDEITDLFLFENELVWLDGAPSLATLATCRVEACSSTLRHVGVVPRKSPAVTSDDERLYWLEADRRREYSPVIAIRSVPRLPAPDGG